MINQKVRMIEDVKNGRRIFHPIIYLIIAFIFYVLNYLFSSIAQLIYDLKIVGLANKPDPLISPAVMLYSFAFNALLVMLFVRFIEGRSIRSLGFYSNGWFKSFLKGAVLGIGLISLTMGILAVLGHVTVDSPTTQPTGFTAVIPATILFFGFIVQGGTEEIISRGWLLNTISARTNKLWGLILSSLFFLYGHIYNSGFNLLVTINIILFSIFLCLYVFKTENIWGAIGIHGAWNFAICNIFGLDVSGVEIRAGSVFDLSVNGKDYIAGGPFGIEGGIIVSLVLAIAIAVLMFWKRNKNKNATSAGGIIE